VQVWDEVTQEYVTAYDAGGSGFSCDLDSNSIWSYDRSGRSRFASAIAVLDGAVVRVTDDHFMTTAFIDGLDWWRDVTRSFATTEDQVCTAVTIPVDSDPPSPVE
jgi:hypothetical protein